MKRNRWLWAVVLISSSLLIGLMAFSNWESPVRVWIALWFLVICPGMALQRLMGLRLGIQGWSLAIAFSLALDTLVGIILLYSGNWSWELGLGILVSLTIVSAILDLLVNQPKDPMPVFSFTSVPARTNKRRTKTISE
ncbi:MAG: hypothetical protein ACYC3H_05675 [Bellilinea sp.]